MKTTKQLLMLLLMAFTVACSNDAFRAMKLHEEGSHVKSRRANGLLLRAQLVSAETLLSQDMAANKALQLLDRDSLLTAYKKQVTILMQIAPDPESGAATDIIHRNAADYSEYKQLVHQLNFGMEERVALQIGTQSYKPVLSTMENIYGLTPERSFLFVFAPGDATDSNFYGTPSMDFVFEDDLFKTGINHFILKKTPFSQSLVTSKTNKS